jgi:hypothetical protein
MKKADVTIDASSNKRPSMAWPHHPEVWEAGKAAPSQPKPVKDMTALHSLAHKSHKLGSSNTAAICFTAAQEIAHNVEKVSYAFMTSTVVPYREMVNALKVMMGTFYSQKRAWWYGRAASDKCVLCGQPDGTLHAVSGCPELSLAATKRHNDAVLLLAKAILTGEMGSQVVAMDVATETQQAEGIQVMSQFMPAKILPGSMPADEQDELVKAHKPDIVLYQGNQGTQRKHKYTFVELKYCRDTQPRDQIMRAQEQHHELLQAIQKHSSATNAEIQLVVIPLGVAGTVYTSVKKRIKEQLGVTGPPLDTLLRNLHIHAVHSLTRIIRYRRIKMGTRMGKQWGHRGAAQQTACTAGSNSSSNSSRAVKSNAVTQLNTRKRKRTRPTRLKSRKNKRKKKPG